MVNNEALAIVLSVACVWAATKTGDDLHKRRWLLLTIGIGGLGLLAKLTVLPAVIAAAAVVGRGLPRRIRLMQGMATIAGAVLIWLPWGLYMYRMHGSFMPSPIHRPALAGGLYEMVMFPEATFSLANTTLAEFALGLLGPFWLVASPYLYTGPGRECDTNCALEFYSLTGIAWLLTGWMIWRITIHRALWFIAVCFFFLYLMTLGNEFFNDWQAILFASRYIPAAVAMISLLVAAAYHQFRPRPRLAFALGWCAVVVAETVYIFRFFNAS